MPESHLLKLSSSKFFNFSITGLVHTFPEPKVTIIIFNYRLSTLGHETPCLKHGAPVIKQGGVIPSWREGFIPDPSILSKPGEMYGCRRARS
jgi:hypothetical protein